MEVLVPFVCSVTIGLRKNGPCSVALPVELVCLVEYFNWWGIQWVTPGPVIELLHWWDGVSFRKIEKQIWKVVMKCRDRLHELVKEEIENKDSSTEEWKIVMERSFKRMDNEIPIKAPGSAQGELEITNLD
ncbi:uncharacterized protein LOC114286104 isoform X2 [Camellia sinensis]|uniref:uncharacterized protein LOC114286104 isoform X2 n=1 Tax=Camellia sinensis TaxID=4442 RepID=UPI001035FBFE|nr:uncharacterized protein LOC114286104 isoform X2 [Camellia sinensis]XP_028084990.1 uncharacterized protein LOC114286104 isoform X2 [Camellia sinensis]